MTRSVSANPNYKNDDGGIGSFPRSFHLEMVQDQARVVPIMRAIERLGSVYSNGVFCELGCGSGIFLIKAAKYFDHVIGVEADQGILSFARQTIQESAFSKKITLIEGDATGVDSLVNVPKLDVLFAEMLSIWLIEEPQIPAVNNYRSKLSDNGFVCPSKIINVMSVGRQDYKVGQVELKAPIGSFATNRKPSIITETKIASIHNMIEFQNEFRQGSVEFTAMLDEEVNCVILNSYVEFCSGENFSSSDSLMPKSIVPTRNVISVEAGQSFFVDYHIPDKAKLEDAEFFVRL